MQRHVRREFSCASGGSRNVPEVFEGSSLGEMLSELSTSLPSNHLRESPRSLPKFYSADSGIALSLQKCSFSSYLQLGLGTSGINGINFA